MSAHGSEPIVFLDIDGVLNTGREYHIHGEALRIDQTLAQRVDRTHLLFGYEHVETLNAITQPLRAKIVLSSTWRFAYGGLSDSDGVRRPLADLRDVFRKVGIQAPLIAATPLDVHHRGEAIVAWLRANREAGEQGGAEFVVIDDESASNFPSPIRRHVLEIDGAVGLRPEHVERAMRIVRGR